jgi:hypothetical protein
VRTSLPDEREQQLVRRFFDDARSGFFVEVGANRPQEQSQTWHLEQLGWSGVLIERRPTLPRSFRGCGARRSSPLPGRSAVSWNPGITRAGAEPRNRGNVWVVQNPLPCLPCEKLGCEGHLNSFSRCMDELPQRANTALARA